MIQEHHLSLVCALSKWVETHLGRVIHLEELAEYSGYSLWHMQKLFKEATGISLGKYIRERRLAGAVYQLRSSEASIRYRPRLWLRLTVPLHLHVQKAF